MTVLLTFRPYSICPNHRRIQGESGKGRGGPDLAEIWSGKSKGTRVTVKYPQAPLIKQVLYLYCVMDTAENINVWYSLAWKREAISDNGQHWRPLTFQWLYQQ